MTGCKLYVWESSIISQGLLYTPDCFTDRNNLRFTGLAIGTYSGSTGFNNSIFQQNLYAMFRKMQIFISRCTEGTKNSSICALQRDCGKIFETSLAFMITNLVWTTSLGTTSLFWRQPLVIVAYCVKTVCNAPVNGCQTFNPASILQLHTNTIVNSDRPKKVQSSIIAL